MKYLQICSLLPQKRYISDSLKVSRCITAKVCLTAVGLETSGAGSYCNPFLRATDGCTFYLGSGITNVCMEHLGIRELKMESWLEIFIFYFFAGHVTYFCYITSFSSKVLLGLTETRCESSISLLSINSADELEQMGRKLFRPMVIKQHY